MSIGQFTVKFNTQTLKKHTTSFILSLIIVTISFNAQAQFGLNTDLSQYSTTADVIKTRAFIAEYKVDALSSKHRFSTSNQNELLLRYGQKNVELRAGLGLVNLNKERHGDNVALRPVTLGMKVYLSGNKTYKISALVDFSLPGTGTKNLSSDKLDGGLTLIANYKINNTFDALVNLGYNTLDIIRINKLSYTANGGVRITNDLRAFVEVKGYVQDPELDSRFRANIGLQLYLTKNIQAFTSYSISSTDELFTDVMLGNYFRFGVAAHIL